MSPLERPQLQRQQLVLADPLEALEITPKNLRLRKKSMGGQRRF